MIAFLLIVLALVVGFVVGRLWEWPDGDPYQPPRFLDDPALTARRVQRDISAETRLAEQRIRRLAEQQTLRGESW